MEYMDVDQVLDVPDTPDRVPVQNINSRNCIKRENNSTVTNHSGTKDFSVKGFRNPPTDRRFLFRSSKNPSISDKSECHDRSTVSVLRSSSSSKNALPLKRMVGDKTAIHETKHFIHPQHMEKGKGVCTSHSQSQSAARQEDSSRADLRKQNGHAQVPKKAAPCGAPGNSQAEESRKRSVSANIISSIPGAAHSSSASSNVCKVKVNVADTCKVGSSFDCGKGIDLVVDSQPEAGKTVSASLHPNTSRRVYGQKRLVRNGCISPLNIAKVKQSAEMANNSPVRAGQDDIETAASDGRLGRIDIRDLITEPNDSHRHKGKAVINPLSSKGPEGMPHRSSQTSNEKTDGTSNSSGAAYKSVEELGGWRSTRNRTKNINLPSSDEDLYRSGGNNNHENGAVRRDYRNESSARNHNDYPNQVSTSSTHGGNNDRVSAPPFAQTVSNLRSQSGQFSEHQHANARIKRQKQASTSSTHGECSTSTFDDSELVCLGSSGEPSNLRSTRDRNHNGLGSLDPVIEIDEFSPEIRNNSSHNIGCSSNDDSDVRARQLEADEMLARELQEELYNEVPGVGVGEIDADIALALQQQESSQRAISSRSRVVRPRGSLISNLRRQSQSLSSRNPSLRRDTQARVPTSARMARLRGSFPGQPRTISSSGGAPLFPPNMDLDMRMHILETLEAFSDMGMPGGALQVQRDFNENDYEMLLALDENNHQHGGASLAQINGLPQSTVQSDNHQEDCAICLDTPTIGDTIRHLPCLHRFHKDCIDPWLRRKTSCPVCKSSIT